MSGPKEMSEIAVLICIVGGIAICATWFICNMIKMEKRHKKWYKAYTDRKNAFYHKMSDRQKSLNRDMQGASAVEKFMVLEARIHELEQLVRNQQDDGK